MARECKKHPGTRHVELTTRAGKNGLSFDYLGCPKCKAEREKAGSPPASVPSKTAKKVAKKAAPLPGPAKPKPSPVLRAGEGFLSQIMRTIGIQR